MSHFQAQRYACHTPRLNDTDDKSIQTLPSGIYAARAGMHRPGRQCPNPNPNPNRHAQAWQAVPSKGWVEGRALWVVGPPAVSTLMGGGPDPNPNPPAVSTLMGGGPNPNPPAVTTLKLLQS